MTSAQKALRSFTVLLGLVVAGLLAWHVLKGPKTNSDQIPSYGTVANFSLTDQSSKPFGLDNLKGKTWVADFVFTRCMGPCPLITKRMSELQTKFKAKKDLEFVSFSVDPEFDTPKELNEYADTYKADKGTWHFLTGPKLDVFNVITNNFHLAVAPGDNKTPGITDIMHSTYFVLVDKEGTVRGYFNSTDEERVKALEQILITLP